MKHMLALFVLATALAAGALPARASGPAAVIASGYEHNAPEVRLQITADYVAIPVTIHSDAKDPVKRMDQLEQALRALSGAIRQYPELSIRQDVLSLSPYPGSMGKKFGSFGGGSDESSAQVYILGALKPDVTEIAMARRIYQAVSGIAPGDTHITLGNATLAVNDPEQYRARLLSAIAISVAETRKALGLPVTLELDALEKPVSVMQINEREVVLFIDYRLHAQSARP
jgi:hypothetical protein